MAIYEIQNKSGVVTQLKSFGHIDLIEFASQCNDIGYEINIGDIKQTWERPFFKRNRNPKKPGYWIFAPCHKDDGGAQPVTIVEI